MTKVARETIEGALRNVAAEITVEELREDREKVAQHLHAVADETFDKLGLAIDTLHVLDVA